jgi:hypothetical protein
MRKAFLALGAAASLAVAGAAFAANVDPTGHGFVGKGQVQSAFKWNNAGLQRNAGGVTFSFAQTATETASCDFNNQHVTMHRGGTRSGSISSQVAYLARKNKRGDITGFNLNGIVAGSAVTQWGAWTLDPGTNAAGELNLCLSGNDAGPWVAGDVVSYGPIALYVTFGNAKKTLK